MTPVTVLIIIGLVILAFVLGYIISNQIRNNQGRTILVPADLTDVEFQKYFPDLMGQGLRLLTPRSLGAFKPSDRTPFESHLEGKFGNKDCLAADLSVLVRDRTKSPALIPVDVKLETELLSIYKSSETPDAEKVTVAEAVRSRLQNIPDLYERNGLSRGGWQKEISLLSANSGRVLLQVALPFAARQSRLSGHGDRDQG